MISNDAGPKEGRNVSPVIDIEDDVLKKAQRLTGMSKKIDVVNYALRRLVEQKGIEQILADVLLREGMSHRSVMNRLYYAMFYALLALLQDKQVATSKPGP